MPWLLKALLLLIKTGPGRRLLFAVALGTFEVAKKLRNGRQS